MKASRKKLLLAFVAFVMFIAGFFIFEHFRGAWKLKRWKARMAAKREVLDIDRLAPISIPMDRNGLGQMVFISTQLGGLPTHLQPPIMRGAVPGTAVVLSQATEWISPGPRRTNVTWVHVATRLAEHQSKLEAALETIRGGVYHPNLYYHRGFSLPLPHLARFKGLAQWLSTAALHDLHQGQPGAAWQKLTGLLTLAEAQREEPLIISQLVRCAVVSIAFALTWEILQYDCWSDAQLAELQKTWAAYEFFTPMEKALSMERAIAVLELDRIRSGELSLGAVIGMNGAPLAPAPSLLSLDWISRMFDFKEQIFFPLWRFAWSQQDELNFCERMQYTLEEHRQAVAQKSGAAMLAEIERSEEVRTTNPYHLVRCLFSRAIQTGTAGYLRRAWSAEVMAEIVVTAVALKRYVGRHQKLPTRLEDLVPEFLERVPIDYMDGRPLRYCVNPDSTWLLYSVGLDGSDDGGDASISPRVKSENPSFQNGRDLVWPQRAPPEDVGRLRQ